MKFLIIVNPNSGKRVAEQVRLKLEEELQRQELEADIWMWDDIEAIEGVMAEARKGGYDGILAAGGDGTFHHVAKRLVNTDIPVGIVPVGTGNGIGHHFHLPTSVRGSIQLLKDFKSVPVDVAAIDEQYFFGFFGIGIDAAVAHRFSKGNQRSFFKYVYYSVADYRSYKPELLRVIADGEELTCRPHLLSILNTSEFGSHAKMAPGASVADGELDLIYVMGPPVYRAPEVAVRIFTGRLEGAGYYKRLRAKEIIIERPASGPAQMDGEAIFTPQRVHIRALPGALKLIVPAGLSHAY